MTPGAWKPRVTQVARSQLTAALLGLAIAHGLWWRGAPGMQSVLDGIARHWLGAAAQLAFRFGSAEDARAVLTDLLRTPGGEELTPSDDMVIQLQLGVLDGEQDETGQPTPHLDAARKACGQAGARQQDGERPLCAPAQLRSLMLRLAADRLVPRSG